MDQKTLNIILTVGVIAIIGVGVATLFNAGSPQMVARPPASVAPVLPEERVGQTPSSTPSLPAAEPLKEEINLFINDKHGLQLQLPTGYMAKSEQYGVTDAKAAEAFVISKSNAPPSLHISTDLVLPTDKRFDQFIQTIFQMNKDAGYTSSDFKRASYGGVTAYGFDLKTGYKDTNGGQLLDEAGGKVVFLMRNNKILRFLRNGVDTELDRTLNSLQLK